MWGFTTLLAVIAFERIHSFYVALNGLMENAGIALVGISITSAVLTLVFYCTLMFRPQWFWKVISFISFKANKLKGRELPTASGERKTTIRSKDAARVSDGKSGKRISQSSSYSKTQKFEGRRSPKKKQNFDKNHMLKNKATETRDLPSKDKFNKELHRRENTKGNQAQTQKLERGKFQSMVQKPFPKRHEDKKMKISPMKKDSATSTKETRSVHNRPQEIKRVAKGGYYHFTLTAIGGILRLYFIVLHFPEGCVTKDKKLKLRRIPQKDNERRRLALITPEIELIEEGASATRFECPIGLEIRPSMLPKDPVKSVQVEVIDNFNEVTWIETEKLKLRKHQQFVTFKLQRFFRVRVVCDSSLPLVRQHYLFHTLFVERPMEMSDPRKHIMKILIYSDHDKMCTEAAQVLRSPSVEVIAHRELIQTRPPCTFSASLACEGMDTIPESVDFDIDTVDRKVLKTFTITIEKGEQDEEIPPWETVDLHYTAWTDKRGPPTILPFRWSVPADYRRSSRTNSVCSTFNAIGDGAVGQQFVYNYSTPLPSSNDPLLDSDACGAIKPQSQSADPMRFLSVSEETAPKQIHQQYK